MIVSLIIIFFILILGHISSNLEIRSQRPFRKQYIFAISIILILQSGLRNWAVGADTYQYYLRFEDVKTSTWADIQHAVSQYYIAGVGKDLGYDVFQKLIQYVLPHYQLFLLVIAVIFFSSLGCFIYKNTTRITDAVLAYVLYSTLFYGFFSITGQRQTIATAASLYAYELIKKRQLIPFLFLILLASTIHKSVLVFIPFYYIAPLKKISISYWAALLLFPVLMFYKVEILEIIHVFAGYQQFGIYKGAGTYTFSLMLLLIAGVSLLRYKAVSLLNNEATPIYNAFLFALLFTPLTWVNPSAMRIVQYYSIFMLVLVPSLIQSFDLESPKIRKLAYTVSLCLLIGLFVNANFNAEYKFYWQEMSLGANY
jgi:transmembrane protein EpsG